jgi:hypothetical protein
MEIVECLIQAGGRVVGTTSSGRKMKAKFRTKPALSSRFSEYLILGPFFMIVKTTFLLGEVTLLPRDL